jgi:hypothetical protein
VELVVPLEVMVRRKGDKNLAISLRRRQRYKYGRMKWLADTGRPEYVAAVRDIPLGFEHALQDALSSSHPMERSGDVLTNIISPEGHMVEPMGKGAVENCTALLHIS